MIIKLILFLDDFSTSSFLTLLVAKGEDSLMFLLPFLANLLAAAFT